MSNLLLIRAENLSPDERAAFLHCIKGNKDFYGPQEARVSNTMNPFTSGSAGTLTQLVVSLMSDSGGGADMWKDRASSFVSMLLQALVFLRDIKEILLDVGVIRDYLQLDKIIVLSKRNDLPTHIKTSVKAYLSSIPGFKEDSKAAQSDTVLEQHSWLTLQWPRVLRKLDPMLFDAHVYGFNCSLERANSWSDELKFVLLRNMTHITNFQEVSSTSAYIEAISELRGIPKEEVGTTRFESRDGNPLSDEPQDNKTKLFISLLNSLGQRSPFDLQALERTMKTELISQNDRIFLEHLFLLSQSGVASHDRVTRSAL